MFQHSLNQSVDHHRIYHLLFSSRHFIRHVVFAFLSNLTSSHSCLPRYIDISPLAPVCPRPFATAIHYTINMCNLISLPLSRESGGGGGWSFLHSFTPRQHHVKIIPFCAYCKHACSIIWCVGRWRYKDQKTRYTSPTHHYYHPHIKRIEGLKCQLGKG